MASATYAKICTCALDQMAMDFNNNMQNIVESIKMAKREGCRLRLGPELEVCGYNCEDHFYEQDTIIHCWECLESILRTDLTDGIICDIGMPVLHGGVRYNCRVILLNRQILMIRPKMWLAEDGNYREGRWFAAWAKGFAFEDHTLPRAIREITGQTRVKFGVGAINLGDTKYAVESCEELFTANNPGIVLGLAGVEIIGNGSGSHHVLQKRMRRYELIQEQTKKNGGAYLYANQLGCDGGRLYFDGCAQIGVNGHIVCTTSQFSVRDVEIATCIIDLSKIRSYRAQIASRSRQGALTAEVPSVDATHFYMAFQSDDITMNATRPIKATNFSAVEEVAYGPACWMWDYLRRSGMNGFFLPLSGGADSAATAGVVWVMCNMLYEDIHSAENTSTLSHLRRVVRDTTFWPESPKEICRRLFYTCYMGTQYSSEDTKNRAQGLADAIGATHHCVDITPMVEGALATWEQIAKSKPDINKRDSIENIACQNIQARCRMVFSYVCAQLSLTLVRPDEKWPGALLVLGSSNVDEALRGYFTKYDCSSADLNPIGSVSKIVLRDFLKWLGETYQIAVFATIASCRASAELQPTQDGKQVQISEDEMGFTFEEFDTIGSLRMDGRCGPVAMYQQLVREWIDKMSPLEVAEKVKRFFKSYAMNRHKMTILPPAYHMGSNSPDDNRYDLRQVFYNSQWPFQFAQIDQLAQRDMMTYTKTSARTPHSGHKRPRSSSDSAV